MAKGDKVFAGSRSEIRQHAEGLAGRVEKRQVDVLRLPFGDAKGRARQSDETRSTSLPKFSPVKSLRQRLGEGVDAASTTSSLLFMRPSFR